MSDYVGFLDSRNEYYRKKSKYSDLDYLLNFEKVKNNNKLGLEIPNFNLNNEFSCLSSDEPREDIHKVLVKSDSQHVSAISQCFSSSFSAHKALKKILGIDSIITLGSIIDNLKREKMFYESLEKLEYRLKNQNFHSNGINLHAWFTLPDGFVVDVSIIGSIKKNEFFFHFYFHDYILMQGGN
ncbi:hypothetical protein [Aquimarina sediminis]|uniref:hypothetical protein n=1 Tax=Aquimarina sediminis TaxID=2070536 RepID=UPI000CA062B9|nr:hypothetical protein [Aquimarina sediminis]